MEKGEPPAREYSGAEGRIAKKFHRTFRDDPVAVQSLRGALLVRPTDFVKLGYRECRNPLQSAASSQLEPSG